MSVLFDVIDALIPSRTPLPPPEERKRLRKAHGLTVDEVAKALRVRRATVSGWESGKTAARQARGALPHGTSRSIRVPRDLRCRGRRAFRCHRRRAPAGAVCGRGVGLRAVRPGAAGVPRPAARPQDRIVRRPDRSLSAFVPGLDADRGQAGTGTLPHRRVGAGSDRQAGVGPPSSGSGPDRPGG
ncbi:helix-turn-helix transcriptional regulator [Streptomyces werraensis]|uniref:helix-turn-helix transcriptional regulator n=1 Tax=Streptomyces werraensis TaxID=68284 RepID=UPI0036F80B6A